MWFTMNREVRRSGSAEEFFGCLDDIFLSNAVNLQQFLIRAGLAEPVLDAALEDSVFRQQKARMFEKDYQKNCIDKNTVKELI